MAILLTEEDKGKTLAKYLGVEGTLDEIQEKLETDDRVKQFLEKYVGYDVSNSTHYRDSRGYYPFVIRELMFHEQLDENDRPIVNLSLLKEKTIAEIIDNADKLRVALRKQHTDIQDDFEILSGQKHDRFLNSFNFDKDTEGPESEYFFRFWRVSFSRLLKDRGIDPTTTAGKDKATEILKELYDKEITSSEIAPLLTEWPEHMVEDHDIIARRESILASKRTAAKDDLEYKPLYETFQTLTNINFSDITKPEVMAREAFASNEAKKELGNILNTKEPLDEQVFRETINMRPFQIRHDAKGLIEALIRRNDEEYLRRNPTVLFSEFLANRRKNLPFGDAYRNKALRQALETVIGAGPVDDKAVKEAKTETCDKLKANADSILKTVAKRKSRRRLIIAGVSTLTALMTFVLGKMALSGSKEEKTDKAPTEQKPQSKAPEKQEVKKQIKEKAPAPVVRDQKAPAPVVAPTNSVQKLSGNVMTNGVVATPQMTNGVMIATQPTNIVDSVQEPTKAPEIIGKKGNHLIGLHWTGYTTSLCRKEMKNAPELLFKTYFDFMMVRIQETGLTFKDLFKPEYTRQALKKVHNYVWLRPVGTKEELRFYIMQDGRTRDELMEDVLSFHMNCQDVLQSLPVPTEKLSATQAKVMKALGPAIGWSAKQQIAWQRLHPDEAKDATESIEKLTRASIQEHKVDTNNLEAVFMETVEAARIYQKTHPGNKALLLNVDEVARSVANLDRENMAQYETLAPATEARKQIEELKEIERKEEIAQKREEMAQRREMQRQTGRSSPVPPPRGGGSPIGWKTLTAVGVIAYLWGRRKRRGG